jgi:opacity protein-like surface antigen
MLLIPPVLAAAEDTVVTESTPTGKTDKGVRNSYVGFHVIQSNYSVKFSDPNTKRTYRAGGFGGIIIGAGLMERFAVEIDFDSVRIHAKGDGLNSSYADNYNLMISGKYGYEFFGFFKPYVGIGVGPSYWNGHYAGKWNFSYQAFTGISLNLTRVFDVDLGVKIQNLGRIPDDHVFKTTGGVINTETRIGILWKY